MTRKKTEMYNRRIPSMRWFYPVIFALVVLFSTWVASATAPTGWVDITTRDGVQRFSVEIMRTPQQRAQGLMFRRSLDPDHGMLFDFAEETAIRMWMKNTFIPLDMIFISENHRIVDIVTDTVPHSTDIIAPQNPARYVLEVNAGTATRLGIREGDRVQLTD